MPQLDSQFWQDELQEILELIIQIWLLSMWSGAEAVIELMNEAGMPGVDEAEVYAAVLGWIAANAPAEANLILSYTMEVVEQALSLWNGEDEEDLVELLAPAFSDMRAESISVTEIILATTIGNLLAWEVYGIIEEVVWMTAEDERVCPVCGAKHEEVISLQEALYGGNRPPAHTRCRCWLEAILVLSSAPSLAEALFSGAICKDRLEEVAHVIYL